MRQEDSRASVWAKEEALTGVGAVFLPPLASSAYLVRHYSHVSGRDRTMHDLLFISSISRCGSLSRSNFED